MAALAKTDRLFRVDLRPSTVKLIAFRLNRLWSATSSHGAPSSKAALREQVQRQAADRIVL